MSTTSLTPKLLSAGILTIILALGVGGNPVRATVVAAGLLTESVEGTSGAPNTYTISLTNNSTAKETITSFEFASGVPPVGTLPTTPPTQNYLTASPTSIVTPTGWTSTITHNGSSDGYGIKFSTTTAPLAAGATLTGFGFQSPSTIVNLRNYSTHYPTVQNFVSTGVVNENSSTLFNVVPPLPMTFVNANDPTLAPDSVVYITFSTAAGLYQQFHATYFDPTSKTPHNAVNVPMHTTGIADAISLAQCGGLINLGSINSGVVYISIGSQLGTSAPPSTTNASAGGNQLWTAGCEITYLGNPADSGDITAINAFSFPVSAEVTPSIPADPPYPAVDQIAEFNLSTPDLISGIQALSTTPDAITVTNGLQVLRVLAPGNLTPNPSASPPYPLLGYAPFTNYVKSLNTGNVSTTIYGVVSTYTYTFKLTADKTGDILLTGSYTDSSNQDPGAGKTYTFTLPPDDAATSNYPQSQFIYTSPNSVLNTAMTLSPTSPTFNLTVEAQVLHDMEVGFNLGFINSATADPVTKVAFGKEDSAQWIANDSAINPKTNEAWNLKYKDLQPNGLYYNKYAEFTDRNSDGGIYGTAYADALPGVTLNSTHISIPLDPTFTPVNGWTVTVGAPLQSAQTITFPAIPNQTVGAKYTLNATSNSGLPVTYTGSAGVEITGSSTTGYTATMTTAGAQSVTANQTGNYSFTAATPVTNKFTVSGGGGASQTITFGAIPDQVYGAQLTLHATASSGLPVSYAVKSGPATLSGAVLTFTGTGVVTVTASQAGNAEFNSATPVNESIVVNPKSQTLTFPTIGNQVFSQTKTIQLKGTATSGLPVTYSKSGPAEIRGSTLTLTGTGSVSVRAHQDGNADYSPAPTILQTFKVTP
jgi:hypothetical protein